MSEDDRITRLTVKYKERAKEMAGDHKNLSLTYGVKNTVLNMISIITTSISAVFTSIYTSGESIPQPLSITLAVLLYISAFINSFQQIFNYEKLSESHRTSSLRYNALYENIRNKLNSDEIDDDYIGWLTIEYDKIFSDSLDTSGNYEPVDSSEHGSSSSDSSKITREDIKKDLSNHYHATKFLVNSFS